MKGQRFVLTGVDTYSGYGFAFPACNASAKSTIHELTECLYPLSWYSTLLLLTEELNSQPEKCDSGPMIMKSSGLIMFPIILKQLV